MDSVHGFNEPSFLIFQESLTLSQTNLLNSLAFLFGEGG